MGLQRDTSEHVHSRTVGIALSRRQRQPKKGNLQMDSRRGPLKPRCSGVPSRTLCGQAVISGGSRVIPETRSVPWPLPHWEEREQHVTMKTGAFACPRTGQNVPTWSERCPQIKPDDLRLVGVYEAPAAKKTWVGPGF